MNKMGYTLVSSPSGEIINDISAEVGKGFFVLSDRAILIPLFQGEYRHWNRTVPGGFSPMEDYVYFAAGLGVRGDYAVTDRLALTGKIGWEYMIDPTNQTAANPSFSKPSNLLSLGARPIYQVSVGADYHLTEHIHAVLELDYSRFSFGQSPPVYYFINTRRYYELEPPSLTNDLLGQLGIAWSF